MHPSIVLEDRYVVRDLD